MSIIKEVFVAPEYPPAILEDRWFQGLEEWI